MVNICLQDPSQINRANDALMHLRTLSMSALVSHRQTARGRAIWALICLLEARTVFLALLPRQILSGFLLHLEPESKTLTAHGVVTMDSSKPAVPFVAPAQSKLRPMLFGPRLHSCLEAIFAGRQSFLSVPLNYFSSYSKLVCLRVNL